MRLDAIGITTTNLSRTVGFYQLLGFKFPEFKGQEPHLEAITGPGEVRLMIDTAELITEIMGVAPKPANHSAFAVLCESPAEVNAVAEQIKTAGFKIIKEPWDAFWEQRYAIVEDPDGYKIDLFAAL